MILLSYDAGFPLPPAFLARINAGFGDVNSDNATNSTDALIILSYDAGFPVPYPVGQIFCPPSSTIMAARSGSQLLAKPGEEKKIFISAAPVNNQLIPGEELVIPLTIDISQLPEKLGSYTVELEWNPEVIKFKNFSGGSTPGFENPVVNTTPAEKGQLIVAHANPYGAEKTANILNVHFEAVGEAGSSTTLSLKFRAMAAARTFIDLLPYLEVSDQQIILAEEVPQTFKIDHYPNPFNPAITIRYQLPKASGVKLIIYNVLGQQVRKLINHSHQPGYFKAEWDGHNDAGAKVGSGLYIYRFEAGEYRTVQKIILLK